ncbi:MAG: phospholipase D-like domain-containing protein [Candidatus Bathyarchaeota archaeon]|nr:phospholipase D-like domain-containing protein [Candidatus Bathyarchaeota archaeon]
MTGVAIHNEDIQTLIQLGCTRAQAKVYITLTKLGLAGVKAIAEQSEIPRQEIYRLLSELQDKGLIEKIVSTPTKYKAAPIDRGLSSLIERKAIELQALQENTDKLIQKLKDLNDTQANAGKEETSNFVLLPEKDGVILRIKKAAENAQKNIDMMCPAWVFTQWLFYISETYVQALKRGVKIRVITDKNGNINTQNSEINTQPFTVYRNFKLKTVTKNLKGKFMILDNQQIYMSSLPTGNLGKHPCLWTTSKSILEIVEHYFEKTWNTGRLYKETESTS